MNTRNINTRVSVAAVGACAALALAACGGTSSDQEAIDALVESFGDVGDDPDLSDSERRCVATEIVESLGAERSLEIDESDIEGRLPLAEAEVVADSFVDCVDVQAFFRATFAADEQLAGAPEAFTDCLIEQIGDEGFRGALVSEFSGEGDADAMANAIGEDAGAACIEALTPEELDELLAS